MKRRLQITVSLAGAAALAVIIAGTVYANCGPGHPMASDPPAANAVTVRVPLAQTSASSDAAASKLVAMKGLTAHSVTITGERLQNSDSTQPRNRLIKSVTIN